MKITGDEITTYDFILCSFHEDSLRRNHMVVWVAPCPHIEPLDCTRRFRGIFTMHENQNLLSSNGHRLYVFLNLKVKITPLSSHLSDINVHKLQEEEKEDSHGPSTNTSTWVFKVCLHLFLNFGQMYLKKN